MTSAVVHKCEALKRANTTDTLSRLHRKDGTYSESESVMTFECEERYATDRGFEIPCTGIEADDVAALKSLGECRAF